MPAISFNVEGPSAESSVGTSQPVNPIGWWGSFVALFAVGGLIYIAHYHFAPAYTAATGQPYLVGYLIAYVSTVSIVFAASLLAYRREGKPLTWSAFAQRYRLRKMTGADWLWSLVVLLVTAGIYFALSFTAGWLTEIPLFAPHPAFPPDMTGGFEMLTPGVLFGMPLKGQWWVIGVYFFGWVLNILGEEFWYRGWMLPRQELAFGRFAWLVNGGVFTFQHTLQPWNYLMILPGALFMVYVIQRRQNTWIGIIQHGLMNLSLFLFVIQGITA